MWSRWRIAQCHPWWSRVPEGRPVRPWNNFRWQMIGFDNAALRQHNGTLHDVFELAYVARPEIGRQTRNCRLRQSFNTLRVFLRISSQKVHRQCWYVGGTFAQRRKRQTDHIEAIE